MKVQKSQLQPQFKKKLKTNFAFLPISGSFGSTGSTSAQFQGNIENQRMARQKKDGPPKNPQNKNFSLELFLLNAKLSAFHFTPITTVINMVVGLFLFLSFICR